MKFSYGEAVRLLLEKHAYVKKNGLTHVLNVLSAVGNPQKGLKCIHVSGTNGKGSVCSAFESVLIKSGIKTGLFSSPHLLSINERIRFNGENISDDDFAALFSRVWERGGDLSFFEILTCMSLLYFREKGADIAVMEVGIGGKYDTTNVIDPPPLCVITSVSMDHTRMLGSDLASIASQKAGIIKNGSVCVFPENLPPEAMETVKESCASAGAETAPAPLLFEMVKADWDSGKGFFRNKEDGTIYEFASPVDFQAWNLSCVLRGAAILREKGFDIPADAVRSGLAAAKLPARFQIIRKGSKTFIVDGFHNADSARQFARNFRKSPFASRDPFFIFASLSDKDYEAVLREIMALSAKIRFVSVRSPRSVSPWRLADAAARINPEADIEAQESFREAVAAARRERTVCAVGSFYLAGDALMHLGGGDK